MASKRDRGAFRAVSDAELELLKVLWEEGAHSPRELQQVLEDCGRELAYTTVQTLLHRLLHKGFVMRRKHKATQVYRAALSRDDLLAEHMDDLATRVCDGERSPLMLSLAKAERLTPADLDHLRGVLERAERRQRRRKKGR